MTRAGAGPIAIGRAPLAAAAPARRAGPRRAMILIVVLVVIAALSLAALTFAMLMVSEREVAQLTGRQVQALALAESGIEAARLYLMEYPDVQFADGAWYGDAERFQGVLVVDDELAWGRGRFAIVAPSETADATGVRFGLECESAKLNLNTLLIGGDDDAKARDRLLAIPGMTEELADCILDWLDEDDEPREFGAESEYYTTLDPPYRPTNGPIRCLEELLFVRGVTAAHLYGADRNRNGVIGADEAGAVVVDDGLERGWSAYLTPLSRETPLNRDGEAKIDLNQDDAQALFDELEEAFGEEWAAFIVGYRQQQEIYQEPSDEATEGTNQDDTSSGGSGTNSNRDTRANSGRNTNSGDNMSVVIPDSGSGENRNPDPTSNPTSGPPTSGQGPTQGGQNNEAEEEKEEIEYADRVSGQLDLTKPLSQKLDSPLDLIDKSIKIQYQGDTKKWVVVKPLFPKQSESMREYLAKLLDYAATDTSETISGRINVNLAPAAVLASVPDIDAELAESIVLRRPADPTAVADYQRHPTWLLVDELVDVDQMKTLLAYLTTGGSVYRVQAVGFFDEGGSGARLEAVLDASQSPPRKLSLKNLTPLGRGFDPAELGAEP
ncbi:MAG TPA: hypothetical protein DD670_19610 [Planctomycetaceae bacterium]|nr:hypothetical protein [Planctomycetaceae bacterium]